MARPPTDLKISRILHAGYLFEYDGIRIIFDPIFENPFSGNCHAFPSVQFDQEQIRKLELSAIFISHFHDDHCSFESLNLLDRATPIYLYCIHDELFELVAKLGFKNIYRLSFDRKISVGAFDITPRRPMDSDIDSMLQINVSGLKILNVVDSVMDTDTLEKLAAESPWDLVLWPFQTMQEIAVLTPSRNKFAPAKIPEDWLDDLKKLNPRYLIPSACQFVQEDWSWYNRFMFPITYSKFKSVVELELPTTQIVRMDPGSSFVLSQNHIVDTDRLDWVVPVGAQDVDFDYRPDLVIPSTAEVARHLPALTKEEAAIVTSYCSDILLTRYRALDVTNYFSEARVWVLKIYDHSGETKSFWYQIDNTSIELIQDLAEIDKFLPRVSWQTEIPSAKLFAALERGETLTSMYLRVNDCRFSDHVEAGLKDFNVLEDPLIQTLFTGRFGAYQREQLRKLGLT